MLAILRHVEQSHLNNRNLSPLIDHPVGGELFLNDYEPIVSHLLQDVKVQDSLVKNHKLLAVQYNAHCAKLMHDLSKNEAIDEQIEVALFVSALLLGIYGRCLDETDSIRLMRGHQFIYRRMLRDRGYNLSEPAPCINEAPSLSKLTHDLFTAGNRHRLSIARVRRFLIVAVPLLRELDMRTYCIWVGRMGELTEPVMSYLAWLALAPRLIKNLGVIAKHLIPHPWMSKDESRLQWTTRLIAQLKLHWFELANDIAVVSIGLLNCFLLTGAANIYLGFSLFVFDVVLAAVRAYIEIRDLKKLEAEYQGLSNRTLMDEDYLQQLHKRIHHEDIRLKVQVINTVVLLVAATFSLPIIVISPVMPLIGASIAVLITILHLMATKWLEQEKPDDTVRYGFFAPRPNGVNHPAQAPAPVSVLGVT